MSPAAPRRVASRFLLAAALLSAGCSSNLEPLPPTPSRPGEVPSPSTTESRAPAPPPHSTTGAGLLDPSVEGERVLEGVLLRSPRLDGEGVATFGVLNETGRDLPDLILGVVFAVDPGTVDGRVVPRIVTVEVPLARGEERTVRAAPTGLGPGETAVSFRVVASPPELLAAAAPDQPGTTFLGGLLECALLEADLTAMNPSVTVGLAEKGPKGALPGLEAQLLLARAGSLVWSGPWILVPGPDPALGGIRRIHWRLPGDAGVAGCSLFLRVRERR